MSKLTKECIDRITVQQINQLWKKEYQTEFDSTQFDIDKWCKIMSVCTHLCEYKYLISCVDKEYHLDVLIKLYSIITDPNASAYDRDKMIFMRNITYHMANLCGVDKPHFGLVQFMGTIEKMHK